MANFISRMFTPSKSDNQSGAQYNTTYNALSVPTSPTITDATAAAKEATLAKKRKMSKTILTGSEGLDTNFDTTKKTLLGE